MTAADGVLRFIGQPLGMIQRPVPREVTSMTSVPALLRRLNGNAAYWTRLAEVFRFESAIVFHSTRYSSASLTRKALVACEDGFPMVVGFYGRFLEALLSCIEPNLWCP